jgi:hypothetical protein
MNSDRKIKIIFDGALVVASIVAFFYTLIFARDEAIFIPVFIAFATVGGTLIHGKPLWAKE